MRPTIVTGLSCFYTALVLQLVTVLGDGGHHATRLPFCESHLSKLPPLSPQVHELRDLFQIWLVHRKVEKDMTDLLQKMKDPPTELAEKFAWKTDWNETYVANRQQTAASGRADAERSIEVLVKTLRASGILKPETTVQDLVHCASGHLSPRLFPDLPVVSFMLQYFKRPRVIQQFVDMLQACQAHIPCEFLVNVDSPQEGQLWANLSWSTKGFVVPVMSYNIHELRGYNRLAGMARGKYMVLLQDDDLMEPRDCSWLPHLVRQFEAMPSLAMVGMNKMQLSHGPGNDPTPRHFMDPHTGNQMIFAFQVDLAPLAIRRSAFKLVGGLDEGLSDPGECGIWSDWELSIRFWVAGWHVAFMDLVQKRSDDPNDPGGTHKPETGVRCWGRQQNMASSGYMARWGAGWGNGPGKFLEQLENHVRLTNLRNLKARYTTCPFRKGCKPEGDPPLPEQYQDYKRADTPMVEA